MSDFQIVELCNDGELRVSTQRIATEYKSDHKNVIALVRRYLQRMETFGRVAFETRPFMTDGGMQSREVALLNEYQAGFLVSLMRNSAEVVDFKLQMMHEFRRMRESLAYRDVTLLTRRILLEQREGRTFALASIGSGLMLDRKALLPGIKAERAILRAVMEPGLWPEELDRLHVEVEKRNAMPKVGATRRIALKRVV